MNYDEAARLEKTIKEEIEILKEMSRDPNISPEKRALLQQEIEKLKTELSEVLKEEYGTQIKRKI